MSNINDLIKLAESLDREGLIAEANYVDSLIRIKASLEEPAAGDREMLETVLAMVGEVLDEGIEDAQPQIIADELRGLYSENLDQLKDVLRQGENFALSEGDVDSAKVFQLTESFI
tara:strand:- start:1567 stop:1914 length:348 start_codon:yes stop_codon:yes gene_type:complete